MFQIGRFSLHFSFLWRFHSKGLFRLNNINCQKKKGTKRVIVAEEQRAAEL
ncbi:hypothetical protein BHE74_00010249 [Ensete ventricosum]|uniref:Uncharacterized protein n=1 Tax=Ensete ventricosum TaxID=4639 RepID=A0A444ECQ8_ENSVE|nr:hypothetical protein GW17_00028396 [Ensete ventricosum]RWW81374.1 hypothetical protein BHE74_00010249 [Ensete ventricosum]RZR70844.1 hypothetical protein BHM03_00001856 [Ensete ventricosum]